MGIAEIKKGVSDLTAKEQASLAYWIISNLDASDEDRDSVETAWRQEVRSRVNDIKTGRVKMIPAAKMWSDLLGNYGKTG